MAVIDFIRETLKELETFEKVLNTVWEWEDTTMDETNAIIRPSSGKKYYWKDICQMETYSLNGNTIERVSQISSSLISSFFICPVPGL